ncbi:MAG: hypothetical protein KGV51_05275 [Moraxellaceae bacterium]|nr:hypothetical protein [Moraxellaceae bacterium]
MSSQTTFTKNKYLSQAVFIALMSASGSSYAVNFGETAIQSAQNEPLLATIEVKDISNAKDFKVSLANSAIYKQMGLTPNAGIKATFKQTSANGGKIILKSSKPISSPFADVVLNINNNNKKQFMPKTLLMPISEKHRVNIIASDIPQNLPKTSLMPKPEIVAENKGKGIPNGEFAKATQQAFQSDKTKEELLKNKQAKVQDNKQTVVKSSSKQEPPIGTLKTDDILLKDLQASTNKQNKSSKKPEVSQKAKVAHKARVAHKQKVAHKKATQKKAASKKTAVKHNKRHTRGTKSGVKYVVQRNDNLWTIANEIAKNSKVNVHTVMKTIQQQNPKAFAHGNARMLIANKTLVLPSYAKVPSQKSLEKAISARRADAVSKRKQKKQVTLVKSKRKTPAKKHKKVTKKVTKRTNKKSHVVAKSKPHVKKSPKKVVHQPKQAHVSLVAPNSSKSASNKSAGSVNKNPLVSKLKHSRLSTAHKVTKVKRLNTKVSSYTKKLQLQNRKLAQLEARLKKLRGK